MLIRYLIIGVFWLLSSVGHAEQPTSPYSQLPVWPGDDKLAAVSKDKYVFWDPTTAEIVMSYPNPSDPRGARTTYRYRPQNQVDPQISIDLSREADGNYRYRYTLKNRPSSRRAIDIFSIVGPGPDSEIRVEHPSWGKVRAKGSRAKQAALPPGTPDGEYIDWASGGKTVPPGGSATDFVIISNYRPGFTTAYAQSGGHLSFSTGGPPPEVARELIPLMKLDVNSRATVTLGPRFPPTATNNLIASDYRVVIRHLAKEKLLADASDFFQVVLTVLDHCAASAIDPCLDDKRASYLKTQGTGLEREIATAILLALK